MIFSFTDFFALNPGLTHFVGLDNYIQIFKDDVFSQAFFNTVKFVIIIVPLQGIGALVLALLINKVTHCKKYFKVAFFVPVVMSLAVVSTLWIQIYSPEGIMNAILSFFGIDAQPFINSASQALPSIAIMSAWQGMGYQMIIFLGGIQAINPALYEAARWTMQHRAEIQGHYPAGIETIVCVRFNYDYDRSIPYVGTANGYDRRRTIEFNVYGCV